MKQPIVGFSRDEEGDWVAELACGHRQHVRHRPPWENRPWVLTDAERTAKLGEFLDCPFCEMPALPPDVRPYKRTRSFTEVSVPEALLRDHRTKAGTWGRIVVERGKLEYTLLVEPVRSWVLRPGIDGIIPPEALHHVRPVEEVEFYVEFSRDPGEPVSS